MSDAKGLEIRERTAPGSDVVYEAIHAEGIEELERPSGGLLASGIGAGLAMGFSFLVPALLYAHIPTDAKWAPLIYALGYPIGFIIVILGRQQLFTENTVTATLPVFSREKSLTDMLRVWGVVLVANVIGAALLALVLAKLDVVDVETHLALKKVAEAAHATTFATAFLRAIFAGWLIALVVWLLPFAETARLGVIFVLTWIIGVAHFPHIVAGTVDGMFLVFVGERPFASFAIDYFVPALLGNVIGGVLLVAAINHWQVGARRDRQDAADGIIVA